MIDPTGQAASSEQARMELAMAAQMSEQRNQPKSLIVLSMVLLVGACIFLLWSISVRASAFSSIREQRVKLDELRKIRDQINESYAEMAARGTAADPFMNGKIEALAAIAQLKLAGPITDQLQPAMASTGLAQKKYIVKAINQRPKAILDFLASTQTANETTGLEIQSMAIRPGGVGGAPVPAPGDDPEAGWSLDVTFTRWERTR